MNDKVATLNPKSLELLTTFDEAALTQGYESMEGVGGKVVEAEQDYKEAKTKLEKHVLMLENRIRKLDDKIRQNRHSDIRRRLG
jgi:hypothetical protein